ncbi:hypothetical protein CCU68_22995 [Pseudomonas gingeri NCPPB 3146 = LMG 5327]|uniref:Uncharacterized protein n=1 Tax=Pseudomonas gingeri NCPPB 3146 = LMG 5327 TaxID=707248 RepID=A0ABX4XYL2_9PSED|nr:hypothetical protein CCU68_22995 [Pseudomonas gingeri NCPPB 3146 = LMG 5327]
MRLQAKTRRAPGTDQDAGTVLTGHSRASPLPQRAPDCGAPLCGSRLAGDDGRSGDAKLTGLIASKPAPTGFATVLSQGLHQHFGQTNKNAPDLAVGGVFHSAGAR